MARKMMRYILPAGDNSELIVPLRNPNYTFLYEYERNVYVCIEEDDEALPELATLRLFETGEAVEGEYIGTLVNGKRARHLYWVNAYDFKQKQHDAMMARVAEDFLNLALSNKDDDEGREYLRGSDTVSEVRDAGISGTGGSTSRQGEEL